MRSRLINLLLPLCSLCLCAEVSNDFSVPDPVPPVYEHLKDLHLETGLVSGGKATATIISPASGLYDEMAARIQQTIRDLTDVTVPIARDDAGKGEVPIHGNLVVLGNRSTNATIKQLYDLYYCILDLKYPGPGGYNVRTVHNPFGDGYNVVLIGGSDTAGVEAATQAFLPILERSAKAGDGLSVDFLMEIKLAPNVRIEGLKEWDAGRQGAYGWNKVSRHMAMYYMTGREEHARHMLRYAFPDDQTRDELQREEFNRYLDSPLAESSDYDTHFMNLFWDLVEESPVFTDGQRLKITNALARQLIRRSKEEVYRLTPNASKVTHEDMHNAHSALCLHTLGRYFQKDYPNPIWEQCLRAARLYYSSLHDDAQFAAGADNLEWYSTEVQPLLNYMILTGWRVPIDSGLIRKLLRAQEAIITGSPKDWGLDWASLAYLNKAAYLTRDGRWGFYRNRTGLDTDVFRLGQSFWPEPELAPRPPEDLVGKWTIYRMPDHHRRSRETRLAPDAAFYFGSFRSTTDGTGDYILLDGYNGEARNPYHAFTVSELRMDGRTVLQGYRNQVLVSADGLVEPRLAMEGALKRADVVGDLALTVGEVSQLWSTWRRTLAQRAGRYAVVVDDVRFRRSSETASVTTFWETTGRRWRADEADQRQLESLGAQASRLQPGEGRPAPSPSARQSIAEAAGAGRDAPCPSAGETPALPGTGCLRVPTGREKRDVFEIHMSDPLEYRPDPVPTFTWNGSVKDGDRQVRFSLIARPSSDPLACLRLADNAAALALPQPALLVAGVYDTNRGATVLLARDHLFGQEVISAGLGEALVTVSSPVDLFWDLKSGVLEVIADQETLITLRSEPADTSIELHPGRHRIEGVLLPSGSLARLHEQLSQKLKQGYAARAHLRKSGTRKQRKPEPTGIRSLFTKSLRAPVVTLKTVSSNSSAVIHAAAGKAVYRMRADGTLMAPLEAGTDVRVMTWWPEPRLLLAGTTDNRVIAFNEAGNQEWVFKLQFDPGFYGPGDDGPFTWLQYWPQLTGIQGLHTGVFLNGESQAFVGSTNTLDFVDRNGRLLKRLPVLRGMVDKFALFDDANARRTLLLGRQPSDWDTLTVIDNVNLKPEPEGFHRPAPGHREIWAWMQNRPVYLACTDLDADGNQEVVTAIDGVWNRVSVWRTDGTPLAAANFPPGEPPLYRNLPGVDVGDLDGDGKAEIIVATDRRIMVALDHRCERIWSRPLPATPMTLKVLAAGKGREARIVVGDETGSLLMFDGQGQTVHQARVDGRPTHIVAVDSLLVVGTDKGQVTGFSFE